MATPYCVPGVYYEPQPRQDELPFVRTDVVGFIGFDPRVRESTPPSRLLGDATVAPNAATAAANVALMAVGNVRASTQAIVAGGVFGPVPAPLQVAANQSAQQADDAAFSVDGAASFILVPALRSALTALAVATRAAAAAARQAASSAIVADATGADGAAAAAQAATAVAVGAVLNGAAAAQNAIAAADAGVQAVTVARTAVAAVVTTGAFPPVNPQMATVTAAGAACTLAGAAVRAAVLPLGAAVSDAAAAITGALQTAADVTLDAADASSRPAAAAAADAAAAAAGDATAGAATVRAAIVDLDRAPPVGHLFSVDVSGFQLVIGGARSQVPTSPNFPLSQDTAAIPIVDGGQIVFAVVAVRRAGAVALQSIAGPAVPAGNGRPLTDDEITAATTIPPTDAPPWVRIADVVVSRIGRAIRQVVHPALSLTRCDDWRDYLLACGEPREDGTCLAPAVRAFFANGGRRCFIATVQRPGFDDNAGLAAARFDMVGVAEESEALATGLARLLLVDDVMVVDVPDLYARHVGSVAQRVPLPPPDREACIERCAEILPGGLTVASRDVQWGDPLYAEPEVLDTHLALLRRCIAIPWRVLLLLTPPLELDPVVGIYTPPTVSGAQWWRQALEAVLAGEAQGASCAALYFPWVEAQERVDAPLRELPPTPFAAGIIARRDLARGPHVAPANETVRGVVALTQTLTEAVHGDLYEPPTNINVLRAFAGYGIQVWGARTLSPDRWLRYLPIRRCLSAIERRVYAALRELVFEPNTPFLWMQVTHVVLGVLMPLFDAGAMRGSRPDEAFYIRCDETTMTADDVQNGRLICEVGVALAAPAEFVVFRVGRREGVIEIVE